jgi:hypothetical protein
MTGPWGGIQSELPLSLIEKYGVADAQNVLFRRGTAAARPAAVDITPFPLLANEPILAIASFYDSGGAENQIVITISRVIKWQPNAWTVLTGPALSGIQFPFAWAVLNQELCFTQAFNNLSNTQVMLATGGATYTLSSANAPASVALAEVASHLIAGNTIEGGSFFPQRYRWSGVGDPTDWTSFSAGVSDQIIDLGPIMGIKKLGQYGFGFHLGGLIQIIPTGIGTNPFAFIPMISGKNAGTIAPFSIAKFTFRNVDCAGFVGKDNIYIFNQTDLQPIGDAPVDGNKRVGARKRIFADLALGAYVRGYLPNTSAFVSYTINGDPFFAYWLLVSEKNGAWVYNLDEGNWTFFDLSPKSPIVGGDFLIDGVKLTHAPAIGSDAVRIYDYSAFSEKPISLKSGKLIFDDRRHQHTAKRVRVVVQDIGACTYSLVISNERGQTSTQPFTCGTGSGDDLTVILPVSVPGMRLQWTLSANAGQPFSVIEVAPLYDEGGEQRGGNAI